MPGSPGTLGGLQCSSCRRLPLQEQGESDGVLPEVVRRWGMEHTLNPSMIFRTYDLSHSRSLMVEM